VVETGDTQPLPTLGQTEKLPPLSDYEIIKAAIAARFVALRREFERPFIGTADDLMRRDDRALLRGLRK
jgi:hypothetical protein